MTDLPAALSIKEEGPREGFQIEKAPIPTDRRIRLVDALSDTGLDHIQVMGSPPGGSIWKAPCQSAAGRGCSGAIVVPSRFVARPLAFAEGRSMGCGPWRGGRRKEAARDFSAWKRTGLFISHGGFFMLKDAPVRRA